MPETLDAYASYLAEVRMRRPATIKRYIAVLEDFVAFLTTERNGNDVALDAVDKKELTAFLRRSARGEKESSRAVWNARLAQSSRPLRSALPTDVSETSDASARSSRDHPFAARACAITGPFARAPRCLFSFTIARTIARYRGLSSLED